MSEGDSSDVSKWVYTQLQAQGQEDIPDMLINYILLMMSNNKSVPEIKEELKPSVKDDGTFWIEWGDFQMHFNKVYVCRIMAYRVHDPDRRIFSGGHEIPGETPWCRYEIDGSWTNAEGRCR